MQFNKFITINDLYIAYRKSKQEAFYDSFYPNSLAYSKYEKNLHNNLSVLYKRLTNHKVDWHLDVDFIGEYLYIPKSIDDSKWDDKDQVHYRSVDPCKDWLQRFRKNSNNKLDAKFRLTISPTVDYQIISALWIIKVGEKLDKKLDDRYSFGNRLRRYGDQVFSDEENYVINKEGVGLFVPYFSAYKKWREKGLDAMDELLNLGKEVTAITMDLASFYHRVNPKFLLRDDFLSTIDVNLNAYEKQFTKQLVSSISTWYKRTPDYSKKYTNALPVGLSASKVISNILLYELDLKIVNSINPKYYGRYVDDLFLVFETPSEISSGDSVLEFLCEKIDILKIKSRNNKQPAIVIELNYAQDSHLEFEAKKQKIFSLSAEYGLDLVKQISSQIRAQSSEYRMLPDIPRDSTKMAEKTLLASSDASLIADALRKADVISIRRLGLSLLLRDIESYSKDLSKDEWYDIRKQFYGLTKRYLLTPKGIFEYSRFYSRIFQVMITNNDFNDAREFIEKLRNSIDLIRDTTNEDSQEKQLKCCEFFTRSLLEVAIKASTHKKFEAWEDLLTVISYVGTLSNKENNIPQQQLKELGRQLLISDLGFRPYKDFWYYEQDYDAESIVEPKDELLIKLLRLPLIDRFRNETSLKKPHWPALAFPTRPMSIQEISLVCPKTLFDIDLFKSSVMGLRGARLINDNNMGFSKNNTCNYDVPYKSKGKINIALTSFETSEQTYYQSIDGKPDRSLERYERINGIINNILKSNKQIDYIVFPECSFPIKWAISAAWKLGRQGVSLIAGVEYYKNNVVNLFRNDALISLSTSWPGYLSNLILLQPKIYPSHDEFAKLKEKEKALYIPNSISEQPLVYRHGDFHFGILICSDLTNPNSRVKFQGKIDALFLLAWNADTNTFGYLIESAAHDIHAFIIQVNNRCYGDSRVRTPYRKSYKRDLVRLKGGIEDYFVIAEIDYLPLREYQVNGNMTDGNSQFKPTPVGFVFQER